MPISDTFVTPAKGNQVCKKIRASATPTTYGTITKELLKMFRKLDVTEEVPPSM
jgi:hypothetical protein